MRQVVVPRLLQWPLMVVVVVVVVVVVTVTVLRRREDEVGGTHLGKGY